MNNEKRESRFNYYYDWTGFYIGISIAKPHMLTGWNLVFSLDLGFFSMWIFFNKTIKSKI